MMNPGAYRKGTALKSPPVHSTGLRRIQLNFAGQKAWLWNVMDSETRYILASLSASERTAGEAQAVLREALAPADNPTDIIASDKLPS